MPNALILNIGWFYQILISMVFGEVVDCSSSNWSHQEVVNIVMRLGWIWNIVSLRGDGVSTRKHKTIGIVGIEKFCGGDKWILWRSI